MIGVAGGSGRPDVWGCCYKKNGDIVARRIAGEMFLVPVRGRVADLQRIFSLNPVGELIWQDLEQAKSLGAIRDHLQAEYDVPEAEIASDIRTFVQELLDAGLISIGN